MTGAALGPILCPRISARRGIPRARRQAGVSGGVRLLGLGAEVVARLRMLGRRVGRLGLGCSDIAGRLGLRGQAFVDPRRVS